MDWEKFSFEYHLDQQGLFQDLISIEAYKEASLTSCSHKSGKASLTGSIESVLFMAQLR